MFSLHSITKAFYEAIRLQLIADGRLVDYTLHTSGTAGENALAYENAKKALAITLKTQKQTVVEVYKPTGFRNEGELKGSRISIELNQVSRGSVGSKNSTHHIKNNPLGTSFTAKKRPSHTNNLEFEITTFATDSNDDYYMIEFLTRVFNNGKGAMQGINADNSKTVSNFNYEQSTPLQLDNDDTAIRRYMRFDVKDIFIISDTTLSSNVVPFSTFVLDLQAYFENVSEQQGEPYPPPDILPPTDDCSTYEVLLENENSKFVQHNLGYFPLIQIMDNDGNSVVGDIVVIDENRFSVFLNKSINGKIVFGKLTTLYDSGFYNTII